MLRSILAVIAGFIVWTLLWLAGHFLFFAAPSKVIEEGHAFTDAPMLGAIVAYSVLCSLAAGLCAGLIVKGLASRCAAPTVLGVLLLLVGIAVEISVWDLMPVWYHLSFLVLLIPATLLGTKAAQRSVTAARE